MNNGLQGRTAVRRAMEEAVPGGAAAKRQSVIGPVTAAAPEPGDCFGHGAMETAMTVGECGRVPAPCAVVTATIAPVSADPRRKGSGETRTMNDREPDGCRSAPI